MRVICITHATGEQTKRELFSGLTIEGRAHVIQAATLFRERSENIDGVKIEKILTSPHARCVETVLWFARGISGYTPAAPEGDPRVDPEIYTHDRLREDMITANVLRDIAEDVDAEAIMVGTHNNLFKALPRSAQEMLQDWIDEEQFFIPRPVIVTLDYYQRTWEPLYCAAITPSRAEVRPYR